jgi:hypothetical protein
VSGQHSLNPPAIWLTLLLGPGWLAAPQAALPEGRLGRGCGGPDDRLAGMNQVIAWAEFTGAWLLVAGGDGGGYLGGWAVPKTTSVRMVVRLRDRSSLSRRRCTWVRCWPGLAATFTKWQVKGFKHSFGHPHGSDERREAEQALGPLALRRDHAGSGSRWPTIWRCTALAASAASSAGLPRISRQSSLPNLRAVCGRS